MFETESSIDIAGSLEKVYAIAETYPRFVPFYEIKEILFEDEEKIIVKISSSFYGIKLTWEGEGLKNKNNSINFIQTKGLLKGLKARWTFEDLKDNTVKVSIRSQIDFIFFLGKIFEKFLGVLLIPNTLKRILYSLKYAVEGKNEGTALSKNN